MKITLNYRNDTVVIDRRKIPFDLLRQYLLKRHSDLCSKNFVKAIKTRRGVIFTYDWENIFHIVRTTTIANEFVRALSPEPDPESPPIRSDLTHEIQLTLF